MKKYLGLVIIISLLLIISFFGIIYSGEKNYYGKAISNNKHLCAEDDFTVFVRIPGQGVDKIAAIESAKNNCEKEIMYQILQCIDVINELEKSCKAYATPYLDECKPTEFDDIIEGCESVVGTCKVDEKSCYIAEQNWVCIAKSEIFNGKGSCSAARKLIH